MHIDYLVLRTIRHILPSSVVRQLLRRGLVIRPGLETSDPQSAVERYITALAEYGRSPVGQRVMIFGYGGRYGVACGLLARGARHVTLCDRFAPPDDRGNLELLSKYGEFLGMEGNCAMPRREFITLSNDDIRAEADREVLPEQDLILSSSVYEHLNDPEGVTSALRRLTSSDGAHLHFIDLRDHYFKYPFEMLCYDEPAWQKWLNPGSNLNRLRYPDYQGIFKRYFERVEITNLTHDPQAFARASGRIRPEFLTGDPEIDTLTTIQVFSEA
jgi:hypothetical protein